MRSVYLKGAAALAAVAALLAIATALQGEFGNTEGKMFATICPSSSGRSTATARPRSRRTSLWSFAERKGAV